MAVDTSQPPAELSNIIETTAKFVAKIGDSFIDRVKQKEQNNPKFNFLKIGDVHYQFFLNRVAEHKKILSASNTTASPAAATAPAGSTPATTTSPSAPTTTTVAAAVEEPLPPVPLPPVAQPQPPPEPEKPQRVITEPLPLLYVLEIPDDMNPLDYDTIRLTAQFVAMNGEQFQTGLAMRESKNPQFEFLKTTHHWHEWFRALVESYMAIIYSPKNIKETLSSDDYTDKNTILDRSINRFEWNKQEQIAKKKAEEEADQERAIFASIDWHDFVVVDSIDFSGDDVESLPPPKTFEQLIKNQIEDESATGGEGEMDVEMDTDMDMEDVSTTGPSTSDRSEKLKIIKDYQKTNKPVAQQKRITQVCPMCGQEIPLDEMQEHMRIELMMKNTNKKENPNIGGATLSYDIDIAKNLQSFANNRTDIFGDEEVEIGKTLKKNEQTVEKVVWDGHTGSIPRTQIAAQAAIQEKAQKQQQQQQGMSVQDMYMQQAAAAAGMMPQNYHMMMGMMPFPPGAVPFMPPGMIPPPPPQSAPTASIDQEPAQKKQKTEDLLIPEDDYIRENPGPVTLIIEAQQEGNVQTIQITLQPRDTITLLKEKIKDSVGIAPNKQKLKAPGLSILKDQHSVGFYNLRSGSTITVGLKERGGRKK